MKSKGFTLIELLSVIVILAVIALIAVPMILGVVEKAKKGSAESSALGYADAIDKQIAINLMNSDETDDIVESIYELPLDSKYNIKVKGETPSKGWIEVTKKGVNRYSLVIGNYIVSYDGTTKTVTKGTESIEKPTIYPHTLYSISKVPNSIGQKLSTSYYEVTYTEDGDEEKEIYSTLEKCNESISDLTDEELKNYHKVNGEYCHKITKEFDTEYKTNIDSSWDKYLVYTVASDGVIESIKACAKYDGKEFCLEGSKDGSKFKENREVLLNSGIKCNDDGEHYTNCSYDNNSKMLYITNNDYVVIGGGTFACSINNGNASC